MQVWKWGWEVESRSTEKKSSTKVTEAGMSLNYNKQKTPERQLMWPQDSE